MKRFLTATAALALFATPALATDVTNAHILPGLNSGGLQQGSPGCLYVPTDQGLFTLPLNANPNTPQLVAAMIIVTHASISFTEGPSSNACVTAPDAPTILHPSTP